MTIYKLKLPQVVEALQYTYPASEEMKLFLGKAYRIEIKARNPNAIGTMRIAPDPLRIDKYVVLQESDWIIKDTQGFRIQKNYEFTKQYELL